MNDDLALSRELTALVGAVDGVVGVYTAGPLHRAVGLAVANVVGRDEEPAKVALSREADGGVRVDVAVGVHAAFPVPQTLRAVGDAVRAHLADRTDPETLRVNVTASHIETEEPAAP